MTSRPAPLPTTPPPASAGVVVYADATIATVAQLLVDSGATATRVLDPGGDRAGVAIAADVCEANRLGAGREPVSQLVMWSKSLPSADRLPRPPLRLSYRPRRNETSRR